MRIALGVLIFAGFVVFASLSPLAFCLSVSDGSGDSAGLIGFGIVSAALFGLPGYFTFPYSRRFQALGWLAFASMAYLVVVVLIVALAKNVSAIPLSPDNRDFLNHLTVHYGWVAVTVAVEAALWAFLFRRRRPAEGGAA